MENSHIQYFLCTNCKTKKNYIVYKSDYDKVGYICIDCWKTFDKRIKQLYKYVDKYNYK